MMSSQDIQDTTFPELVLANTFLPKDKNTIKSGPTASQTGLINMNVIVPDII